MKVRSANDSLFLTKISPALSGCWEWVGYKDKDGYGIFQQCRAHRVSYQTHVGPIPFGLEINHLCSNRSCVNPEHLEVVTRRQNIEKSNVGWNTRAKTHCPHNHPYSEDNTYIDPRGARQCKKCKRRKK